MIEHSLRHHASTKTNIPKGRITRGGYHPLHEMRCITTLHSFGSDSSNALKSLTGFAPALADRAALK